MVFGVGGGKVFPIIFGVYLSRWFGGNAISDFVLVSTYVAALSAVSTMGSAPQIIRAGVIDNPGAYIVSVSFFAILILLFGLAASTLYWTFLSEPLLLLGYSGGRLLEQLMIAQLAFGLVFYAIGQAAYNHNQNYRVVGLSSVGIYAGAALSGLCGGLFGSYAIALLAYFSFFMVSSLVFMVFSQREYFPEWQRAGSNTDRATLMTGFGSAISSSLFGLITLAGLFIVMKLVQSGLDSEGKAIFSMAFQLFQVGIFLPSVLGAIVVPRMVLAGKESDPVSQGVIRKKTIMLYALIGAVWLVLVSICIRPLFEIYRFAFDTEKAWSVMLVQFAVVLAAVQAYYIQRFVYLGRFRLLAVASAVWASSAILLLEVINKELLESALALVFAYMASLILYYFLDRNIPMKSVVV